MPCFRRSRSSVDCFARAMRAIANKNRGLTPSPQAVMQSPVSAQPLAQAFDARPFARTDDIEHAGNHAFLSCVADTRGLRHRADLDTFPAARAGIEHIRRARGQRQLERGFAHRKCPDSNGTRGSLNDVAAALPVCG